MDGVGCDSERTVSSGANAEVRERRDGGAGATAGRYPRGLLLSFLSTNIEAIGYVGEAAPEFRFAAVSVLWGLFATVVIVLGFLLNESSLRWSSIVLFAATAVKVFVFDIARARTPYRFCPSWLSVCS